MAFLTVTLNAALDVTYAVDRLIPGGAHRAGTTAVRAGGKGVNVARVLRALGEEVLVTGLAGGTAGMALRADLDAAGIPHALSPIAGETRRTVTIVDAATAEATTVNEPGPRISAPEWGAFLTRYKRLAAEATLVVLSGSLPPGLPVDAYARLITATETPVLLDTSGPALQAAAPAAPALAKPNHTELPHPPPSGGPFAPDGTTAPTSDTGPFAPDSTTALTSGTGPFAPDGATAPAPGTGAFAPDGTAAPTSDTGGFAPGGTAVPAPGTGAFPPDGTAAPAPGTRGFAPGGATAPASDIGGFAPGGAADGPPSARPVPAGDGAGRERMAEVIREGAGRLLEAGAGIVVVSVGADGMYLFGEGAAWFAAPPEVVRGNPTGAGDAAAASLARGLVARVPLPGMLADAVALSAAAVRAPLAGDFDPAAYGRFLARVTPRPLS